MTTILRHGDALLPRDATEIAVIQRLVARPSVSDTEVLWAYTLEYFENNYKAA